MAWVGVAIAVGGATALAKGIQANQAKQRQKGYIEDSYRRASQGLDISQRGARESGAESANARGMAQDGSVTSSPIHTAMIGGLMKSLSAPNTIGGQEQSDMAVQQGLETQDLSQQHTRARTENSNAYTNALIGAGVSGVETGVSAYTGGKDLGAAAALGGTPPDPSSWGSAPDAGALPSPSATPTGAPTAAGPSAYPMSPPTPDRSAIHSALLSSASFDGVHPGAPLSDPSSSWYTGYKPPRIASPGETNASFTVG